MLLIEQIYVRTENGIYDVTYWSKDNNGYYTYFTDDWCEPKQYIYNDDIIKIADNLEDLIDEYRYDRPNHKHCRCEKYVGCNGEDYWYDDNYIEDVKEEYLNTIKGYIWSNDNLICVVEMKEYDDGYRLFLKEE